MLLFLCLLAAALLPLASPSFTYLNFNDTGSLRFNGDASTSSCEDGGPYVYSSLHTVGGDGSPSPGLLVSEGTSTRTETTVLPFEAAASAAASRLLAGFPSRDAFGGSPDAAGGGGCPVRLRLTPSRAFKASSVLRLEAQAVLAGWETGFTLQLTDPSRQCSQVKDATFGAASHRACTVAGGDGLAFVLHGDPRTGSRALGGGGGGLGYSGLPATLAVEFDTWYNAEGSGESGDLPYDHVSVQASPAGGGGGGAAAAEALPAVTATTATRVSGPPLRVNLGDGQLHTVRIAYYPYIKMDFVQRFVGAPPLLQHLGAAGQASAIGTLAVWVDEALAGGETAGAAPGAAQNASLLPTLALPINLHQVLRMDADRAWPGFTASTGSTAWQKHDVLQWYWCDQVGCR